MPRVIFKCPYLKGGAAQAAHLGNYVRYMATRKGAQRIAPDAAGLPATKKQREMVEQLIRDFPLSRGLFEYEDYLASPTRGNASEFITRALEDNYDSLAKKENYISYIASRPRAQRTGAHALFTGSDDPLTLSQIADGKKYSTPTRTICRHAFRYPSRKSSSGSRIWSSRRRCGWASCPLCSRRPSRKKQMNLSWIPTSNTPSAKPTGTAMAWSRTH